MVEKNNRQVLQPILEWMAKSGLQSGSLPSSTESPTALKLADQGLFWVGTDEKKVAYGTIISGQMYVQYLIPCLLYTSRCV